MQLLEEMRLNWDEGAIQRASRYLRERGFTVERQGGTLRGRRGSMAGNLTSFDMTSLIATCRIEPTQGGIRYTIEVDTTGQVITEWNQAIWRMEIIELHHRLCGGDDLAGVWERLKSASGWASFVWAITLGLGGRTLTRQWAEELSALEDRFLVGAHPVAQTPQHDAVAADPRWAPIRQLLADARQLARDDVRWRSAIDQLEQASRERLATLARLAASQQAHAALGEPSPELATAQEANEAALKRVIDGVRQVHGWLTTREAGAGAGSADDLLARISADLEVDTAPTAARHAAARRQKT